MNGLSAQISLYPLGQADLALAIGEIWAALEARRVPYEVGRMSTLAYGEEGQIFAALREGWRRAITHGPAVMVITLSNACPAPSTPAKEKADG